MPTTLAHAVRILTPCRNVAALMRSPADGGYYIEIKKYIFGPHQIWITDLPSEERVKLENPESGFQCWLFEQEEPERSADIMNYSEQREVDGISGRNSIRAKFSLGWHEPMVEVRMWVEVVDDIALITKLASHNPTVDTVAKICGVIAARIRPADPIELVSSAVLFGYKLRCQETMLSEPEILEIAKKHFKLNK